MPVTPETFAARRSELIATMERNISINPAMFAYQIPELELLKKL
jgi:hypothetical protein